MDENYIFSNFDDEFLEEIIDGNDDDSDADPNYVLSPKRKRRECSN